MKAEGESLPKCPRCGYDLRGTVATWDDAGACPLEGTCTECGLTFRWVDIFDPTREEPKWCVEYAAGKPRPMVRAILATFMRSWLPWMFWKRLRLHHRVRLPRLFTYAIVLFVLPAVVLYVSTQTTVATRMRMRVQESLDNVQVMLESAVRNSERWIEEWRDYRLLENASEGALYWGVVSAKQAGLIPEDADDDIEVTTQEQWEPMWQACLSSWEAYLEEVNAMLERGPPRLHMPYVAAIAEAVFLPTRRSSWGYFEFDGEQHEYPAPALLWDDLLEWGFLIEFEEPVGIFFFWMWILTAYPLTFAALPITRRQAKVRAVHFVRIFLYSLAIPATFGTLTFGYALATLIFDIYHLPDGLFFLSAFLVQVPLALGYWYFAVRTHLRLPRPAFVTIVLSVLAFLAAAASMWIVRLLAAVISFSG